MEWHDVARQVADGIRQLPDGGALLVQHSAAEGRVTVVRRARLLGLVPARTARHRPDLQFIRIQDHLRGECIGARSFGGPFPFTGDEHEALLGLGWHVTSDPSPCYVHFWPDDVATGPYLPERFIVAAAQLAVRTVSEVFGCTDAAEVTVDRRCV